VKKYISTFICGFGAGVLTIVPVAKSFSCCLIIPLAAFFSLILDQKANLSNEKLQLKKGLIFGLITGAFAALFGSLFDLFITLITKHNDIIAMLPELQNMMDNFPVSDQMKEEVISLFYSVKDQILSTGFSPLYALSVIVNNFLVNTIFGMIGGLIGVQIINKRMNNNNITG